MRFWLLFLGCSALLYVSIGTVLFCFSERSGVCFYSLAHAIFLASAITQYSLFRRRLSFSAAPYIFELSRTSLFHTALPILYLRILFPSCFPFYIPKLYFQAAFYVCVFPAFYILIEHYFYAHVVLAFPNSIGYVCFFF